MSVMNNCGKTGTYAVIAPGEVIFSLFFLPAPRFVRPGVLPRASKPMRDWENEPGSILAFFLGKFLGTNGDSSATTVFGFTGRCCRTGAAEGAGTADV